MNQEHLLIKIIFYKECLIKIILNLINIYNN